uniref:BJA-8 n=1 Tax=Carukia barnesi TaxID=168717 RepID=B3VCD3_CARBN|nr:BJA-8 precursor [Carukia barnesi]
MHCICLLLNRRRVFAVAFVIFALCFSHGDAQSDSIQEEDWLRPYNRDHYDVKRTHRHVRSCQPIKHGNVTHEIFPATKISVGNNFETKYFARELRDNKDEVVTALGHVSFVSNPLRTFSVLEPLHAGSCNPWVAPRANVLTTSKKRCVVASNAGYFRTSSGGCIGNIFSNGRLVQTSNGIQNANFGIRKDGSIVLVYLTEDNVRDEENPFVQLVSGVGWLLRRWSDLINC